MPYKILAKIVTCETHLFLLKVIALQIDEQGVTPSGKRKKPNGGEQEFHTKYAYDCYKNNLSILWYHCENVLRHRRTQPCTHAPT